MSTLIVEFASARIHRGELFHALPSKLELDRVSVQNVPWTFCFSFALYIHKIYLLRCRAC